MSDGIRGVVVAHGDLAAALVHETERISGELGVLTAISNDGCGPEEIERRIAAALDPGGSVLFVDMPCGSCFFAAMREARGHPEVRVVTGVNLPMLLDFVHHRALPVPDGASRAADKGAEAIRQP
jgi:mannose/fructose-specific phosphotransferase system component IIA